MKEAITHSATDPLEDIKRYAVNKARNCRKERDDLMVQVTLKNFISASQFPLSCEASYLNPHFHRGSEFCIWWMLYHRDHKAAVLNLCQSTYPSVSE